MLVNRIPPDGISGRQSRRQQSDQTEPPILNPGRNDWYDRAQLAIKAREQAQKAHAGKKSVVRYPGIRGQRVKIQ